MTEIVPETKGDSKRGAPKTHSTTLVKVLGLTLIFAVFASILIYGGLQVKKTWDLYKNNWSNVQFAINPATSEIVTKVRVKYDAKVAAVAGEIIVTDEKKPADRLVEAVIDQVSPKK